VDDPSRVTTFLFTDIEGSTRLWEQEPERMREALARHDLVGRDAVTAHRGVLVKTTGDGLHAAFDDPCDALAAALAIQRGLADPAATGGLALSVRAGIHGGVVERRDHDFFGTPVNRAARIMAIANGGQTLVSQAVAGLVAGRLPPDVSLRDLGSVRLRDLSGSEHVFQLEHPGLRRDFPALRSLESTPNNLPLQLTTFVGREREVGEVHRLLRTNRLVTLFGTGGLGKTRLALQAAAAALVDYPDGVWFVDLAPIADPRLVPQAVASVLGVHEDASRPVADALARFVRERALLVVLDNCEHVADACARLVANLLQASTRLVVLATSRETLRVRGETTYPVPALAVPEPGAPLDPAAAQRYAAMRLFSDRAQAVHPAFAVTERNGPVIAEICRRLDGIPLAIELAAARLRSLPLETIAAKLGDAFRLLSGGDRTALPRQQTLRALIDWSHDLLTPAERALFRRLAVFAGGWSLEAAEDVCADETLAADDVLDLLSSLVDKSLVNADVAGARYRLLDTVRQYAEAKLRESGEEDATRARHVRCYLALAEAARPMLAGPEQGTWLARLDRDRGNILAAHAACARIPGGPASALRLADVLMLYWINRGLLELGHATTLQALGGSDPAVRDVQRSRTLRSAGQLAMMMGRYGEARPLLEESLAIARENGDMAAVAGSLLPLSNVLLGLADVEGARVLAEESLAHGKASGSTTRIAAAMTQLAQLHVVQGDTEGAEPLYREALRLTESLGDRENIAVSQLNLAMLDVSKGDRMAARERLLQVIAIAREVGSKRTALSAIEVAAGLAAHCGDAERGASLLGSAEAQAEEIRLTRDPGDEAFAAPVIRALRTGLGDERFDRLRAAGRQRPFAEAVDAAAAWLASMSPSVDAG